MEELLAAIRRIVDGAENAGEIAEGERDAQEAGGPPVPSAPAAAAPSAPAVAEKTAASSYAEVLVLTEMVQDDGSVVSLQTAATSAPARPGHTSGESPFRMGQPAEAALGGPASTVASPAPAAAAAVVESPSRSPAPVAAAAPERAGGAPIAADLAAASTERLVALLQTTPPSPTSKERIPVSSEGLKKPELVSEEALAASTAALAQLAQSVTRTREPAPAASKTVEELVRESIEPMLKQWLDQNLPRMVERMVREAIDRVVRRVE